MEIRNFLSSGKGQFFIYLILALVWSAVLAGNMGQFKDSANQLWLIFFSVVAGGTFSNSVFVSERISGSLEILLVSGLSRNAIVSGKILFVWIFSLLLGSLCLFLGLLGATFFGEGALVLRVFKPERLLMLYAAACLLNATSSAWLSILLPNPRLSQFVMLFFMAALIGVHTGISLYFAIPLWSLGAAFVVLGILFWAMAQQAFKNEKIIAPISL
jgi:ABC-type transport system involved in cytochrome c biogenesis permease component